jgi:hypothetical protein
LSKISSMWAVGKSGNPTGRPRHSVRTVKGMVERFIQKNITPNKMQKMYDSLTSSQQLEMLTTLLPYIIPKQSTESLSTDQIDELYEKITQALKQTQSNAKVG